MGIFTAYDVINHLPRRYDDYSYSLEKDLKDKQRLVLFGKVISIPKLVRARGIDVLTFDFMSQSRKYYKVVFFNQPYLAKTLKIDEEYSLIGIHKCCGGKTEEFETCWEDKHVPYLESVDCPYCAPDYLKDKTELQQSLNDYDLETNDYHDWQVTYSAAELGEIIRTKSGIDFGEIIDLIPLKRGKSGRIYSLEIVGTKCRLVIGKELTIRRWLSKTCLYSSWFEVKKNTGISGYRDTGIPVVFQLIGHGWGHGVGLCQIGAATMAIEGFSYRDILAHYYPGTQCKIL